MTDWLPQSNFDLVSGLALVIGLLSLLAALRWQARRDRAVQARNADIQMAEPEPADTGDAELPYQVDELDSLAEVDIFIEFGYLGQAAQALRHYVDRLAPHSGKQLQRLAGLYLQTGALDDYALMLERQHDLALIGREALEQAVEAGLRVERNHLSLRVLAEQRLGWGPEEIGLRLGDDTPDLSEEAAEETTAAILPSRPSPSPSIGAKRPQALLHGCAPLFPLNEREKDVIAALLPFERQARVWLRWQEYAAAATALEQTLALRPHSLTHLLDLLHVHYRRRQLPHYARTLWRFHLALGEHGVSLKEQLIHAGWLLGAHPVLDLLAQRPERPELERIGRSFGFSGAPPASAPLRRPLVTRQTVKMPTESVDARCEADAYLSEGQVDMAIQTLEQAVLSRPEDAANYPPLLQLYRRQDDRARFHWLLQQLRSHVTRLPLEVRAQLAGFDADADAAHRRMLAA
ncbi:MULTISPECIES: type IV pilus assembly protein FimV [Chromobacterium]|uniref:Tetratricopeptide repeat protein n=1 Tax=Chromobacterium rhizoryzae TaxID=1778675 RepID=A0AAD0RR44_9NEIS|nr:MULTISPECIES: hypothetical protein [Chromobacterium]AXT47045.1 hypothetical protein D1345_12915 [Chromobacterium rhizoryzae]OQS36731.1 hypothetical protein B0T40_10090 [Chromobacterium haemolyticum]QOD80869.1 hypothetical protein IEZ30_12885 [Chromobacterium haemolyticum]